MNPYCTPAIIKKGTIVAEAKPVEEIATPAIATASAVLEEPPKEEMLWQLVQWNAAGLNAGEQHQFFELLWSYRDIFAGSDMELGRTSKIQHHIHTADAAPTRQAVRRLAPHQREEIRKLR